MLPMYLYYHNLFSESKALQWIHQHPNHRHRVLHHRNLHFQYKPQPPQQLYLLRREILALYHQSLRLLESNILMLDLIRSHFFMSLVENRHFYKFALLWLIWVFQPLDYNSQIRRVVAGMYFDNDLYRHLSRKSTIRWPRLTCRLRWCYVIAGDSS